MQMKVFIQTRDSRRLTLEVNPTDDIEMIKRELFEQRGIPVDQPAIVFNGVMMTGKIGDYDVHENDVLHVYLKSHWITCNETKPEISDI